MRSKFVYSCSIKIWASGFDELLENIFCLLLVVEVFCLQKVETLEEVVVGWWEEGWIRWLSKLHNYSPISLTLEGLVVQCVIRHCHGEELGPFCWSMPAAGIAVFDASHRFAEHTSQMYCFHWNSESCNGSDQQQITKQWPWPFFGASWALGSALELLLGPTTELVVTGCHEKSTFGHMSQSNQEMVCCF